MFSVSNQLTTYHWAIHLWNILSILKWLLKNLNPLLPLGRNLLLERVLVWALRRRFLNNNLLHLVLMILQGFQVRSRYSVVLLLRGIFLLYLDRGRRRVCIGLLEVVLVLQSLKLLLCELKLLLLWLL